VACCAASMATPDSGDSNLPKEPGNKVASPFIMERVRAGMPSFGKESSEHRFQEVEVSKKLRSLTALKETVRHVYFLNLICS